MDLRSGGQVEDYGVAADRQRFLFRMPAGDYRPPELDQWKEVLDIEAASEPHT